MEALLSSMVGIATLALLRGRGRDRRIAARLGPMADRSSVPPTRGRLKELLIRSGRLLPTTAARPDRLKAAGMQVDLDSFRGAKVVLSFAGAALALLLAPAPVVTAPMLGGLGFFVPDMVVTARARLRREEIAAAVPQVVELLSVCTRAGLNLNLGLKRVAERTSGPLGEELRAAVRRMELGTPRAPALRAMAENCDVDQLKSLVDLMLAAEKFGGRVADPLERLAADTRSAQRRAAEEQARRAPVKMLFPLVLLILPAFVLMTIVPILIGALRGIGF